MNRLMTFEQITGEVGLFIDGDWVESKDQDVNGDVRLIQLADVGDGFFIDKSNRHLTSGKVRELRCTYLREGDVLIARMPDPLGRACIFPGLSTPSVTVVDVCIVRPDPKLVIPEWLAFYINNPNFRNQIKKYITGTTRQRISRGNLAKIKLSIPSIEDQKKTIRLLNMADSIRQKRKQAVELLDEYLKSTFYETFGDPVTNPKNWQKKYLKEFGEIVTGNTPPRNDPKNYSDKYIEWIKTDNILQDNMYISKATEYLSELGIKKARSVKSGSLLVACIAGSFESIGRSALTDRTVSFNQQINAIQPYETVNSVYLYWLFKLTRKYIQEHATKGMKKILTKGAFQQIEMIMPPIELQEQFAVIANKQDHIKQKMLAQASELDNQFQALMQKAFN